jgi:hypothetical protein
MKQGKEKTEKGERRKDKRKIEVEKVKYRVYTYNRGKIKDQKSVRNKTKKILAYLRWVKNIVFRG